MKNRPSHPITICASSVWPLPRISMRASATWVELTVLPGLDLHAGLTTPEKRMYSTSLLVPSCFSPATVRLPLASTSITVTVMVPVNTLLLASEEPLPSKVEEEPPLTPMWFRPCSTPIGSCTLVALAVVAPTLLTLESFGVEAVRFSLMLMVRTSPMLRGRAILEQRTVLLLEWKIAPLAGAGAPAATGTWRWCRRRRDVTTLGSGRCRRQTAGP